VKTFLFDTPRALVLLICFIIVGGLASLATMPQEEDPKVTNRNAVILTPLPGASAETVERLITQRLEDELREIQEITTIRSTSRLGLSSVSIEIDELIKDVDGPLSKIRDAVSDAAARLPAEAGVPQFIDDRGYAYTVIASISWEANGPVNPIILKRNAEALQSMLRNIPGTEYVSIHGTSEEVVDVLLSRDMAQSLGLSERDISRAIALADSKGSAGQFFGATEQYGLEVEGELTSLDRLRNVPITATTSGSGSVLRLGDIADVGRRLVDPATEYAIIDGKPAVVIGTRMITGLRVGQWSARVRQTIDAFNENLSSGLELQVIFDQAEYSDERFGGLIDNLMVGIGLVVTILFFTLGWRSALIVTAAIPLTALLSLLVMNYTGIPINQMSITGLIVALGLLVDAAIVVCDAIGRARSRGIEARDALVDAISRLWVPLLSSTLTTVFAFLPISLLPGGSGEFVGGISNSVIIALLSSYVLAIFVISTLASKFLRGGSAGRFENGVQFSAIGDRFRGLVRLSLRAPVFSIALALLLPIGGIIASGSLPEQFFPEADRKQFHVQLRLSPQTNISETRKVAEQARLLLEQDPRIASTQWFVGNSVPAFYYNLRMDQDGSRNFAEAMVNVDGLDGLPALINEMQIKLSAALPNVEVLARPLLQGPPTEAPIELRIFGQNLQTLKELGEEARAIMAQIPDISITRATVSGGEPKLWFVGDEDQARQAGLSLKTLSSGLSDKLLGVRGGTIIEGEEELDVVVRVEGPARSSISELNTISLSNPLAEPGQPVEATPISALGSFELRPSPASITRYNAERVNTVTGYVRADALPSAAVAAFQAQVAAGKFKMPPGYRFEFGGDAEERSDAVGNLMSSIGLISVAMVGVVVLSFNSFTLSLIVFCVAGLSMGLGMLCLALFQFPFGFLPIIALTGLMGVAINAAIIILSGLKERPAALRGDLDEIEEGVLETSRHITSTTITTFMGFLPLILTDGGFWPPFATAIAGGVLLSTVVSFFFVPQMFLLLVGRPGKKKSDNMAQANALDSNQIGAMSNA